MQTYRKPSSHRHIQTLGNSGCKPCMLTSRPTAGGGTNSGSASHMAAHMHTSTTFTMQCLPYGCHNSPPNPTAHSCFTGRPPMHQQTGCLCQHHLHTALPQPPSECSRLQYLAHVQGPCLPRVSARQVCNGCHKAVAQLPAGTRNLFRSCCPRSRGGRWC
jgi:hypothetical protein